MSVFSIVAIIFLIVLVIMFLRYLLIDPYVLNNTTDAKTMTTISASSLATNGSNVPSSNFAYSIWIYINDWNYRYGEDKIVFGRMGTKGSVANDSGSAGVDPCPSMVLGKVVNNLAVSLGCFPGVNETPTQGGNTVVHTCNLANIPIQSWVNITMSVFDRTMDLYINGKLVRTCLLPGVASINTQSDVYITPMGGFDGWTSKFQYIPNALNPQQAWNIYTKGYSSWTSAFNSYQLQVSLVENGTTQSSVTI